MKFESIIQIILLGSSIGLGGIILKKIPVLRTLTDKPSQDLEKKQELGLKLKTGIKKLNPFKGLSYEMLLQKILTSIKTFSLKLEHGTSNLLQELKRNTKERTARDNDHYWEEIKKATKNKSRLRK
jgi:hypothetical protein